MVLSIIFVTFLRCWCVIRHFLSDVLLSDPGPHLLLFVSLGQVLRLFFSPLRFNFTSPWQVGARETANTDRSLAMALLNNWLFARLRLLGRLGIRRWDVLYLDFVTKLLLEFASFSTILDWSVLFRCIHRHLFSNGWDLPFFLQVNRALQSLGFWFLDIFNRLSYLTATLTGGLLRCRIVALRKLFKFIIIISVYALLPGAEGFFWDFSNGGLTDTI